MKKPIGVFDSGIGGITVLKEIIKELPNEDFIYFGDSKNAPYGTKSIEEITSLSARIIDFLLKNKCKTVVIACNTATAATVHEMRKLYSIPIIGLEPAVKPACLGTKTMNIGILATEGTFRGNHFKTTSEKYKEYVTIHLQVAKDLVELAEQGVYSGNIVDERISEYINPLLDKNVDYIVLGCTHYAFFYDSIIKITGNNINIIDSAMPVAKRTKDVLMTSHILNTSETLQNVRFYTSGNIDIMQNIVNNYLNFENIFVEKWEN